jgi:dGTPase
MEVARSAGRRYPEPAPPYRNDYQRDRDRIIHARAFRRLEAKTQVFTRRFSDHFRNRLTHTLEVAQISRTVAGALGLNPDLCEALALVHDIGHPPFGHAGEHKLDALMRRHGGASGAAGFDHNLHALRTVERFEQRYAAFPGLNLTFEVREGIIKHSRDYSPADYPELADYRLDDRPPLEAQLIDLADEIAYNAADLDDGLEARLLTLEEIRAELPLFRRFCDEAARLHPDAPAKLQFNEALRRLINHFTTDLIESTHRALEENRISSVDAVRRHPARLAGFSPAAAADNRASKQFLLQRLYNHPQILEERDRAVRVLEELFELFIAQPGRLPPQYREQARAEPLPRIVCDYIAGMTDNFIFRVHQDAFAAGAPAAP